MTNINWQQAEEEILSSGMVMKLIDGKWCMLRQGSDTIYYNAPTKEDLIRYYFHNDLEDFTEYEKLPKRLYPTVEESLPLLNEPATLKDRRLCLRRLSDTEWSVHFYSEIDDAFYQGSYFKTYVEAKECYMGEVARIMDHYQELVDKFYESKRR